MKLVKNNFFCATARFCAIRPKSCKNSKFLWCLPALNNIVITYFAFFLFFGGVPCWIIKQIKASFSNFSHFWKKGKKSKFNVFLRQNLKLPLHRNVNFLRELSTRAYFKDNFILIKDWIGIMPLKILISGLQWEGEIFRCINYTSPS